MRAEGAESGLATGISWDPFSPEENPYLTYRRLRDERPAYYNAERDVWALTRFEDVQAAARDWETFRHEPDGVDLDDTGETIWGKGNFLDMDPPHHDELRNLVRKYFTPKAIAEHEEFVRTRTRSLIDAFADGDTVDVASAFSFPLTLATGPGRLLGFSDEELAVLGPSFRAAMVRDFGETEIPKSAVEGADRVRAALIEAIADRRRSPRQDLLSDVVVQGGDVLVDDEAIGLSFILFAAAIDTASSLISSSLLLLAENPDQRELLIREPERIPAAVEEFARVEAPVQYTARNVTRDVTIQGVQIPGGSRAVLVIGAANHDERRFDRPDQVDVTRESKRHLSFGEGIHFCLGAPLARLDARVAIEEFLARFPEFGADGPRRRLSKHNLRGFTQLTLSIG
jgi:cytochrome P450